VAAIAASIKEWGWTTPALVGEDADDAPEPPAHPVAEPGDLWGLGRHRLLCGDSTVATDVERVLGGVAPHLMVTDPPYGVNYDPVEWTKALRSPDRSAPARIAVR
jgi:hypothetical protein